MTTVFSTATLRQQGTERIDAGKKAAVTPASYRGGKPKLVKVKLKIGELNSGTYQARQVILAWFDCVGFGGTGIVSALQTESQDN
ncbi:hypothetical protein C4D60_Mb01t30000 [Musa balbisiana]|uniref:Uncharacterized protein n=1 Tax=Musa balbisiana TaxID=52838 RepID=A0A4S8JRS1_MUSBA|nr:hypothetical protein C4D60_Mb01t30000 [Musa balbisiana]